ncbi:hypothetical protein U9M48_031154 [Paspalum notatum var. saurae]|uniref:Disease resistance N-terminal domain-containing protein n=1 Tax=Paspalum notatum var. saurae TaxID=547442 RepID=A0AAQ3U2L8_PASNO
MADLASGAVSSLLGVISSEARLLDGGVRDDVQFIKEEMESMNSFLLHLARTAPPGREHDEQVRTWMAQVRQLAQDCNHCIDHYLYRGSPDIQRARTGLHHYLWWATWYLRKVIAKHSAAVQLRKRGRARWANVGREIPEKEAGQSLAARGEGLVEDEDNDTGDEDGAYATDHSGRRRAISKPPTLDDYLELKLAEWIDEVEENDLEMGSISIVAPDNHHKDALALTHDTLVVRQGTFYDRTVLIDITAVHFRYLPLGPMEVLYYILRELHLEHARSQSQRDLEHARSQSQHHQATGQGEGQEQQPADGTDGWSIYEQKINLIGEIKENIQEMEGRLEKIKEDIQDWRLEVSQLQLDLEQKKDVRQLDLDQKPIHVLLQLLFSSAAAAQQDKVKNKAMHTLAESYEHIIEITAEKLKTHIEDEKEETADKQLKEQKVEDNEETAKKLKKHMVAEDNEETTKQIDEGEQQSKQIEEEAAKKRRHLSLSIMASINAS